MAWRQCHILHFRRIPCGNHHAARIGVVTDQVEHIGDLVDRAVRIVRRRRRPATPLRAVDRPQIAVLVGPFVPNVHVVLLQPTYVRGAFEEPQQLVGQAFEEHRLRGEQWEAVFEIETHLLAEQGNSARARAVGFQCAFRKDFAYQILVRHGNVRFRTCGNTSTNVCELFGSQSHNRQV